MGFLVLGFYMRFEDDSVESAKIVKQWNVKIISISKNKRHQDRAAALDVWDRLEEFVVKIGILYSLVN
ncbi:protein CDC73 [Tanacetum coccineum]